MMPEQSALISKSEESLKAARLLENQGFYSFAVSRAYYAMFYMVQAVLLEEGLTFSKHSAVISAFGKLFVKTGRVSSEYHRILIDAEDARNISDYGAKQEISPKETSKMLIQAADFINMCIKLLTDNADNLT